MIDPRPELGVIQIYASPKNRILYIPSCISHKTHHLKKTWASSTLLSFCVPSITLHRNENTRISNGLFIEMDGNHESIIRYSQMTKRHPRLAKDQDMMTHPITNQSFFSIISPHPIQSTPCLVAHDDAHHAKW